MLITQLKPYQSVILARLRPDATSQGSVLAIVDDLTGILSVSVDGPRRLVETFEPAQHGELHVAGIHYEEVGPVPWTTAPDITDRTNHLALVCRRKRHFVIFLSDTSRRRAVLESFGDHEKYGMGRLEVIPRGIMNAAFVRGQAKTLWLSGTHRRTTVKADSKVLSGINLQEALDPVEDQTYHFTAARTAFEVDDVDWTTGVSPKESRIWIGSSRTWTDFRDTVAQMLRHIEQTTKPQEAPLPVVAVPTIDFGRVDRADDAAILLPETATHDPTDDKQLSADLLDLAEIVFDVTPTEGASFNASVRKRGETLGTVEFQIATDGDRVNSTIKTSGGTGDLFDKVVSACRGTFLKVWYESGHTISDGQVFEVRYRDQPFTAFSWGDFEAYRVDLEKPDPINQIGEQGSLFCWLKNMWPKGASAAKAGWLACDDGAGEIADFIHLEDSDDVPILSFIHAKGAHSVEANRQISVAAYEVVTAQAIKNLRSVDRAILEEGLEKGVKRKVRNLVWRKRAVVTRTEFLKRLKQIGSN